MPSDLQSLRTYQWIGLLGGVAGILAALAIVKVPHRNILLVAVAILLVGALIVELRVHKLSALFLGVSRYYATFPIDDSDLVFRSIKGHYSYLGLGFSSCLSSFQTWYGRPNRPAHVKVRLLLVDPSNRAALELHARHELNLWGTNLTTEDADRLAAKVKLLKDSIEFTLETLASIPVAKDDIQVYFHHEHPRMWVHIVDEETLYVGLLQMGRDGRHSPVIQLQKRGKGWGLYDYYHEACDWALHTAKKVNLSTYRPRA